MALAPSIVINLPGWPFENFPSLATIAALRAVASSALVNGENYVVDGGGAVGDGAGGVYVWNDASVDTDDGSLVIKPTDTPSLSAGRWVLTAADAIADAVDDLSNAISAPSGAAMIGGTAPSGTTTNLQRHIVRNYLEDISGFVEGSSGVPATNTTLLNAAIASGVIYNMRPGALYKIGASLVLPSNSGLVFEGGNRPTIYMPAASFNNVLTDSVSRYGTNAVGINCSGQKTGPYTANDNILLENFILQSEVSGGRCLRGIVAQNVTDFNVNGIELFGFPAGIGVCVASVRGNSALREIYAHDFTDNTNWGVGGNQITGIEVDNDRVNSVGSEGLLIYAPKIRDITVGATFLAAHGYETDGINIVHNTTRKTRIISPDIYNVGEGIDCFGSETSITGGTIDKTYIFGIKFPHGAAKNTVSGVTIRDAGLGGILFSGSNTAGVGDTQRNVVTGCTINNIDPDGVWSASETYCIGFFTDTALTYKAHDNLVADCILDPGANGKRIWNDSSNGATPSVNARNIGRGNIGITGAGLVTRSIVLNNGGSYAEAGAFYGAQLKGSTTQSLGTSGTPAILSWDTEDFDTGENSSSAMHINGDPTKILPVKLGFVDLSAIVTFAANATGLRTIEILKNGTLLPGTLKPVPANASGVAVVEVSIRDYSTALTDYYEVRATQTSGGALNVDLTQSKFSLQWVEAR